MSDEEGSLITQGRALFDQENHAEALPLFQTATIVDPDSFEAWSFLARTLLFLNQPDAAKEALERAIALEPDNESAQGKFGDALMRLERYDEAVAAYEVVIQVDPDSASGWASKGAALCNLKRYDEALIALDRALNIMRRINTHGTGRLRR